MGKLRIKLVGYESTWGCSYCHCFNHILRGRYFLCGADKKTASWIVDEKGYNILDMGTVIKKNGWMRMRMRHLVPNKNRFDNKRFNEITQEDFHPTHKEIENSYKDLLLSKGFDFLCGDVLEIISEENDYELYYFVSANGLELIERESNDT